METTLDPVVGAAANANAALAARDSLGPATLGRDDFLKLLIAQLQNQDPMEPAKDTEFMSQLATFSSLEQLISANANLENLALGQASLLNSQALTLIGREALVAAGDTVKVEDGKPAKLMYQLPQTAHDATLTVYGADGVPLRVLKLDASGGSWKALDWDGLDSQGHALADGDYRIEVSATGADGQPFKVPLAQALSIDGIRFGGEDGITLVSGDRELPFDEILEIRAGA
jgi:flagellar basal-body rod modification protein FlgD